MRPRPLFPSRRRIERAKNTQAILAAKAARVTGPSRADLVEAIAAAN